MQSMGGNRQIHIWMSGSLGQQAFASDDMRQRMGLAGPSKKGCQFDDHSAATGLLVPVEAIAAAYRTGTPWGCAAAEDLQNSPFKRCAWSC